MVPSPCVSIKASPNIWHSRFGYPSLKITTFLAHFGAAIWFLPSFVSCVIAIRVTVFHLASQVFKVMVLMTLSTPMFQDLLLLCPLMGIVIMSSLSIILKVLMVVLIKKKKKSYGCIHCILKQIFIQYFINLSPLLKTTLKLPLFLFILMVVACCT